MKRLGRHMRGVVVIGMVRALRKWMRHTGAEQISGLSASDLDLLTSKLVEPEPWYPYDQYLRLMGASFEILCRRDWTTLREYCSRGVGPVYELGYERLLHRGDPVRTMQAVSVMWRSCHDFGTAFAQSDADGTTVHVIDYPDVGELDGNVNAGWFLGMARCAGAEVTRIELRRCPWNGRGHEQVVRLEWRVPAISEAESDRERGADSESGTRAKSEARHSRILDYAMAG